MTKEEKDKLRYRLEIQYRFKLYSDPAFPYFQSMGVQNIFQGFRNGDEYLGHLEMRWRKETFWEAIWHDEEATVIEKARDLYENSIVDWDKVMTIFQQAFVKSKLEELKKQIEEKMEEEITELLN